MKIFMLILVFIVGAIGTELPTELSNDTFSEEGHTRMHDFVTLFHILSLVHLHPQKLEAEAYMNSVSIKFTK